MSLEDNLVIHHKDLSRHSFIQDRDSGQIEALDRDNVKASTQSEPCFSTDDALIPPYIVSFVLNISYVLQSSFLRDVQTLYVLKGRQMSSLRASKIEA